MIRVPFGVPLQCIEYFMGFSHIVNYEKKFYCIIEELGSAYIWNWGVYI